jgi:hypothetical protein
MRETSRGRSGDRSDRSPDRPIPIKRPQFLGAVLSYSYESSGAQKLIYTAPSGREEIIDFESRISLERNQEQDCILVFLISKDRGRIFWLEQPEGDLHQKDWSPTTRRGRKS